MNHFDRDKLSAIEAKQEAQRIAFAPFMFQAAKAMRDMGVLAAVESAGDEGMALEDIRTRTGHSLYAVRVLAEAGLGIGMLILREDRFALTKLGWHVQNDAMTRVNMDFTQDINFKGLLHLQESLETGTPAGLKEIAPGFATVYEALATLPEQAKKSWFGFDHFYSDNSFRSVLPIIFGEPTARILDVGANTGKWAVACAEYAPEVRVTMCDLPGQLAQARVNIAQRGLSSRVAEYPIDVLRADTELPQGHDVIWMSQFLDCFSEAEITAILRKAAKAMTAQTRLYIMETYWDRQRFENAAFCLQQTSLYFTCIANGNSQMYHSSVLRQCIADAGLEVAEDIDGIGLGHTLTKVVKRD
ncbi:SAM-dependent methyltransferase [uncultured Stenotrophomonas sp.]|uniref:SAM-dependent methyltransferase n=1 Tax=uncultured Stenotrophomonas sp. TaxID=165438 RepID=A0A1Y5Q4S3_9GAMM|nr:SAM-dependent methyltransferase [uncultured Stenotrophomonas sp.]